MSFTGLAPANFRSNIAEPLCWLILLTLLITTLPLASSAQTTGPAVDVKVKNSSASKLLQQARDSDLVRVIVGLETDHTPEHRLVTGAAVKNQRRSINRAQEALLADLNKYKAHETARFKTVPGIALAVSPEALEALYARDDVKYVSPDQKLKPALDGSVPHILADQLHTAGYEGGDWMVAVLDTGMDTTHGAFSPARIQAEACFSSGADPADTTSGDCPNGEAIDTGPGTGAPVQDAYAHGTKVGGVAAGSAVAGLSLADGVAPSAPIFSVNVAHQTASGYGIYQSDVIRASEHVYEKRNDHKLAAVNYSIVFPDNYTSTCDGDFPQLSNVFDNFRNADIAPVVATGNDGEANSISPPACLSSAVPVAATGLSKSGTEGISSFSNRDPNLVDLAAPGSQIYTAAPNNDTDIVTGTSYAAPHVAGAWALVQQSSDHRLSVDKVRDLFVRTGSAVSDSSNIYRSIRLDAALNDLTFTVLEQNTGNPVEAADIKLTGVTTKTTNSNGTSSFNYIYPDTYSYEVTKDGYSTAAADTLRVWDTTALVAETVRITEKKELEITANDTDGNPVEDATVKIDGVGEKKTDAQGKALFYVDTGVTYDYSIEKTGYLSIAGTISIDSDVVTVAETLTREGIHGFRVGPNPFNPGDHDHVRFQIKESSSEEFKLEIYTIKGELVYENTFQRNGPNYNSTVDNNDQYLWSGKNDAGNSVASGYYLYYFKAPDTGQEETGKLAIVR